MQPAAPPPPVAPLLLELTEALPPVEGPLPAVDAPPVPAPPCAPFVDEELESSPPHEAMTEAPSKPASEMNEGEDQADRSMDATPVVFCFKESRLADAHAASA